MTQKKRNTKAVALDKSEQRDSNASGKEGESQGWKGELFRRQFKKTIFCRFYASGKCKSGAACTFAHTMDELHEAPDLTKTSLCAAWQQGCCTKTSKQCQFAHGAQELRMTPLFKVALPVRAGEKAEKGAPPSPSTLSLSTTASTISPKRTKGQGSLSSGGSRHGSFSTASPDFQDSENGSLYDIDGVGEKVQDLSLEEPLVMQSPTFKQRSTPKQQSKRGHAKNTDERNARQWMDSTLTFLASASAADRFQLVRMLQEAEPDCYED